MTPTQPQRKALCLTSPFGHLHFAPEGRREAAAEGSLLKDALLCKGPALRRSQPSARRSFRPPSRMARKAWGGRGERSVFRCPGGEPGLLRPIGTEKLAKLKPYERKDGACPSTDNQKADGSLKNKNSRKKIIGIAHRSIALR